MICTTPEGQLNAVPTKTGEVKSLTHDQINHGPTQGFPDEKQIAFLGQEPGRGQRIYVQDVNGGAPRAITPQGTGLNFRLSPDEKRFAVAMDTDFKIAIYPVSGGDSQSVAGIEAGEVPAAWSPDGRFLYCYRLGSVPVDVFQVEVATGRRIA